MPRLLARLAELLAAAGTPPERVRRREVALLEGDLGRPMPSSLRQAWSEFGSGRVGAFRLLGADELSSGLATYERFLDQGLLPLGSTAEHDLHLELGAEPEPIVLACADFPVRLRMPLGTLERVLEVLALDALVARGELEEGERERLAARLERVDPERRVRDPLGWAERQRSAG